MPSKKRSFPSLAPLWTLFQFNEFRFLDFQCCWPPSHFIDQLSVALSESTKSFRRRRWVIWKLFTCDESKNWKQLLEFQKFQVQVWREKLQMNSLIHFHIYDIIIFVPSEIQPCLHDTYRSALVRFIDLHTWSSTACVVVWKMNEPSHNFRTHRITNKLWLHRSWNLEREKRAINFAEQWAHNQVF